MSDIQVLWLDDDSPEKVEGFPGIKIVTAQTCAEAERMLSSGEINPDWAVIDLIVPQDGWGDSVKAIPGLNYIHHLKRKYGDRIGIVAFSIVMPDRLREKVLEAGASDAIAKSSQSWASVLDALRKRSSTDKNILRGLNTSDRKE